MRRVPALVLVLAALGGGCRSQPTAAPLSVLLVTIDTLRADRIGRGVAPALDALSASALRFTSARTTAPLTLPAHTSLLTGLLPPAHGVRVNGVVLDPAVPTLATALHDAGYHTGAFVGAYVLDRRFGLARGFDVYDDRITRDPAADARLEAERRADAVVDPALAWLEATAASPFFLWVHLYDPHAPYDPPGLTAGADTATAYDAEVAYASRQVARLLERLERSGRRDTTVVVVAGDHGEGLGEHGEATHGLLAYDSTLRVPLIVAWPGEAPRDVLAPVSLADVAPSLLRRLRIDGALAADASDRDLFAPEIPSTEVYAESDYPRVAGWHPLRVLAEAQWKLVLSSTPELYDVRSDPGEQHDLAATRRQQVQAMVARLRARPDGNRTASAAPSADAAASLRALGYVGGATTRAVDPAAANPASVMDAWTTFETALAAVNAGQPASALPSLATLSARFPAGAVFQSTYARALQDAGQPARAVAVLQAALARDTSDASMFHDLAVAASRAGDRAEAMRAEQAALALAPDDPAALNGLGLLHAEAGHPAQAAMAFERAAAGDPSNATTWTNLGNARRALDEMPAAEAAYRRALDLQPNHADAANGLGVVLVQSGRAADAVPWLQRAIAAAPDFHEARLNLGIALQQRGDRAQAIAVYTELLRRAPRSATRERQAATELLRALR